MSTKTKTCTRAQVAQAALELQRGYLEATIRTKVEIRRRGDERTEHDCSNPYLMHQAQLELIVELLAREVEAE